ncbi:MAG: chromosomal replication initiator protein DnaA [Deltaproteobacteria bacterium]|nr:chromosomal replication initiator protein DnaA [Deltaproteobacteria bacterium]
MDTLSTDRWTQLRGLLRARLSEQAYATWVSQMSLVSDTPSKLTLSLPNTFALDWVNNHYRDVIQEQLASFDELVTLDFVLAEAPDDDEPLPIPPLASPLIESAGSGPQNLSQIPSSRPTSIPTSMPTSIPSGLPGPRFATPAPRLTQRPQPPAAGLTALRSLNTRYTFDSFVTGPSNQLASAAAQSVSENPGCAYNPLFIFGRVGLGKTHLLQAIGHAILKRNPNAVVCYQTTEQFVNDVVQGIRFERMDEVRSIYRQCDVLMIDDIQFIAGKEACQAEFFHTFNALYDARKQVVLTSDKLPHELKDLEERVRTRFQWGLIVDLQPPELETRIAIVKKKAEKDGIDLPDDVAMFIAQTIRSNVRELEGSLIRVAAYASLSRHPITIEIAKDVLKDIIPGTGQALTCDTIVKQVANHFDLKVTDLKSPRRGRAIALPRQIAMYLCRKHTGASYPDIGNALGGKDHTTALNAFKRIESRLNEPEVRHHVEQVERTILP